MGKVAKMSHTVGRVLLEASIPAFDRPRDFSALHQVLPRDAEAAHFLLLALELHVHGKLLFAHDHDFYAALLPRRNLHPTSSMYV